MPGPAGAPRFAAVDGVLEALLGAGVVPPVAVAVGDGDVSLLDVGEHLLVELFAQAGERRHYGIGVGVFGFEIGGDVGVLFVAEPGVVVDEGDAVEEGFGVVFAGDRGIWDWILAHVLFSVRVAGCREPFPSVLSLKSAYKIVRQNQGSGRRSYARRRALGLCCGVR